MTLGRSTAFTEPFGRNEEGFVLLAFIDESALMHKNDDSPFYVLAAVCFHEWEIAKVDKKIFHAKQKFAALKYKSAILPVTTLSLSLAFIIAFL